MSNTSINVRIRLKDLKAIRKILPSIKDETIADYFHRLKIYLEENRI
jgi:predicted DNA-binding ArsR family transcriptional regulator